MNTTDKQQARIKASLVNQATDVRIGTLTKAEWDRRCDEAVAQGVELTAALKAFRDSEVRAMNVIDSTATVRLIETDSKYAIQRYHPRTGWFTAHSVTNEEAGRAALGSHAELIGEMDQLSPETMAYR